MIPRTIHYCWFGPNQPPELDRACFENWKKKLTGFTFKRWNETNSPIEIPVVKEAYEKRRWAFVSDYIRLYALLHEGGIYLDTDIEIVKDLSGLLSEKCFLGFSQKRYVTNAVMGGEKNHFFFQDSISLMEEIFSKNREQPTSPRITTQVLESYGMCSYGNQTIKNIRIFSQEYFYPYNPFDPERPLNHLLYENITPNTYTIHHYSPSWNLEPKPPTIKQASRLLMKTLFNKLKRT